MRYFAVCLLTACTCFGQDNPLSAFNKRAYGQIQSWVLASAEKMPAGNYAYKPTDSIRSFGQLIGHVADAQYLFCAPVLGQKNPGINVEKTISTKPELVAALKEAFIYCNRAYETSTDAAGLETVKLFNSDVPKLSVLGVNIAHTSEHYGNIVTYLRLKDIVPPSSEPAPVSTGRK